MIYFVCLDSKSSFYASLDDGEEWANNALMYPELSLYSHGLYLAVL